MRTISRWLILLAMIFIIPAMLSAIPPSSDPAGVNTVFTQPRGAPSVDSYVMVQLQLYYGDKQNPVTALAVDELVNGTIILDLYDSKPIRFSMKSLEVKILGLADRLDYLINSQVEANVSTIIINNELKLGRSLTYIRDETKELIVVIIESQDIRPLATIIMSDNIFAGYNLVVRNPTKAA